MTGPAAALGSRIVTARDRRRWWPGLRVGTRVLRLARARRRRVMVCLDPRQHRLPRAARCRRRVLGRARWATRSPGTRSSAVPLLSARAFGAALGERGEARARRSRLRSFLTRNPPLIAVVARPARARRAGPAGARGRRQGLRVGLAAGRVLRPRRQPHGEREDGVLRLPPPMTAPVGARDRAAASSWRLRSCSSPRRRSSPSPTPTCSRPRCPRHQRPVVAHAYGLDLRLTASAIAWATASSSSRRRSGRSFSRGRWCRPRLGRGRAGAAPGAADRGARGRARARRRRCRGRRGPRACAARRACASSRPARARGRRAGSDGRWRSPAAAKSSSSATTSACSASCTSVRRARSSARPTATQSRPTPPTSTEKERPDRRRDTTIAVLHATAPALIRRSRP